ncbi:putative 2-dehydropantoate 2- protein [Botrytis fragariae]|uniref:2-dehydropantoate 2-reductase n=1 Tax=Botrytis fragariae TaxID=1964551 RepID=A0A8H6EIG4_9HELO|nr:putative 2-dehydropantoate 2- protein [Botrytis fragariae]KAF5873467.1 putative 2-dehydropantoate 2- protein [Botrytis fragariae]
MDPTIHILGLGNLGKLFAHSLATKPNPPPLTLLLHRPNLYEIAKVKGLKIGIHYDGVWNWEGQYNAELVCMDDLPSPLDIKCISNLIVTTKSHKTAEALSMLKHRLTPLSTIIFIHNGMGVVEEVNKRVFPNPKERPHYSFGIASHGVYRTDDFTAVFAGHGSVIIGNPGVGNEKNSHGSYLLQQVIDSKLLGASEVPWDEFKLLQLQKLAVNAVINPLTALNDCLNGMLVEPSMVGGMRSDFDGLVSEISQVFCSLPELQEIPGLKERFSRESLRSAILNVASATSQNRSSMLQDVSKGSETEIHYINGYIVRRAQELGIECPVNMRMVADILAVAAK